MNKCFYRIYNDFEGTEFFIKILFNNILLPVLITNNYILKQNIISIEINEKKRYTNEKLDITIIEIKEEGNIVMKYIELNDSIMDCFRLNKQENPN